MYIIMHMVYTLQGGGRRKIPEPQTKADSYKQQIKENDGDFLDPFMHQGYAQARSTSKSERAKLDKMLSAVKEGIQTWAQEDAGLDPSHAKVIAETVTRNQPYEWMRIKAF